MNLKIVILGDEAVGKSSLLAERFLPYTKITMEPNVMTREFFVNDQTVNVEFWDMPGRRELLQSCVMPRLHGTDCCVIVYDVTSIKSFESLQYWRNEFLSEIPLSVAGQWFPFVVVGNKVDLINRTVDEDMIESWCIANEVFSNLEISAKSSTDVTDALQIIVNNAFNNKLKHIINDTDTPNRHESRLFCCSFISCPFV